jgi:hypothetical protein
MRHGFGFQIGTTRTLDSLSDHDDVLRIPLIANGRSGRTCHDSGDHEHVVAVAEQAVTSDAVL